MTIQTHISQRVVLTACTLLLACGDGGERSEFDAGSDAASTGRMDQRPNAYDWGDPFAGLPKGAEQLELVCGRAADDQVRDVFCGDERAEIRSIEDLQRALRLGLAGVPGTAGVALAGHSTSLSLRSVSAINPRVIMYAFDVSKVPEAQIMMRSPDLVALSFNRGDQFVEIVGFDRATREFTFYVVRFEQACNHTERGCTPGDLLTEAAERDWENVTLYDETSLANTLLDCGTCHQPGGPNTPKMLRMQEFDAPWTHWLFTASVGGAALLDDYVAAKGDEPLAGLPREQLEITPPGGLSLFVSFRNHEQPNVFASEAIEREVRDSAAQRGGNQPFDNTIAGTSATWRAAYERAQRGESMPVPYHDVKITDAQKLERMTAAYQAYRAGELPRESLPDLRDVFPDDPQRLAAMGMMTEPGLSGEAVLIEACSMCHNERLDQSLSRARFRADLKGMTREEKDRAIARLSLPSNDPRAMPPARLRVLSDEARRRAIKALR